MCLKSKRAILHRLRASSWLELQELASEAQDLYSSFDLRVGGKWRHIDNPRPRLRVIQRRILRNIIRHRALPEAMHGAAKGRGVLEHAEPHVGKQVVVSMDVESFFPSTTSRMVYNRLEEIGATPDIARLLTQLSTKSGHLPQGGPCSSFLAQMCFAPAFLEIEGFLRDRGMVASMYVDDLAFSGMELEDDVISEVHRIIRKHRYHVNSNKTEVMRSGKHQSVTGVQIERVPGALRTFREGVRAEIFGLVMQSEAITERDLESIRGKISYVKSLNAGQGVRLARLADARLPASGQRLPRKSETEARDCTDPATCKAGRVRKRG